MYTHFWSTCDLQLLEACFSTWIKDLSFLFNTNLQVICLPVQHCITGICITVHKFLNVWNESLIQTSVVFIFYWKGPISRKMSKCPVCAIFHLTWKIYIWMKILCNFGTPNIFSIYFLSYCCLKLLKHCVFISELLAFWW